MATMEEKDEFVLSGNWKLHGEMCQQLWLPLQKLLRVFPLVEAARPGSQPGIQALSMVSVGINKSKNLLQHCSEDSKLYLAMIGNRLSIRFEKEKDGLIENIKTLEELVVSELRSKLVEIRVELEAAVFSADESDMKVGDELSRLIQKDTDVPSSSSGSTTDEAELEAFYNVATKLGIDSYRTALVERRSLKRLLEQACTEEDKLKEKILNRLMNLMQNYSKRFRTERDPDSSCSSPRSDDVGEGHSGRIPAPPEELKCPISLQLMYDPVVVSSGQTFERVSIQKWFDAGHNTCPKTREYLSHVHLTPNSCLKRLIESWCQQNGVPVPSNPPDSPDISPFERALLEMGASVSFTKHEVEVKEAEDVIHKYERWMDTLNSKEGERWEERKQAVLEIRYYLKDDIEARVDMGQAGFVDPLVRFLQEANLKEEDNSQEVGALALYNFAVNNSRNKELIVNAGIISILETMIECKGRLVIEAAIALYYNISCFGKAKPLLVQSRMTSFVINSIHSKTPLSNPCLLDALHALFNLSTQTANVPQLIDFAIIPTLQHLLQDNTAWADRAMLILAHIAQEPSGNNAIREASGLISLVTAYLDSEEETEQEQSATCLLALCLKDKRCVPLVLQEGVIPYLMKLVSNTKGKAKDKADRLLQLFRSQRNKDLPDEQEVIQLDKLKGDALKEVERMEAEATQAQEQERIRRNAKAAAEETGSGSGNTREDTGVPKGLSKSGSKRLGKKVASLLNPKHFSRKNK